LKTEYISFKGRGTPSLLVVQTERKEENLSWLEIPVQLEDPFFNQQVQNTLSQFRSVELPNKD
jgi:hypothetical protein